VECPKAPSNSEDRRTNKTKLKVVAWNVDWLFTNASHDYGKLVCPGPGCDWKNQTIADAHLQHIAAHISNIDPDIIGLEELEDCDTLREITKLLPDYKPYLKLGKDTFTGQNPGILTKIDPVADLEFSNEVINYPVPGSTCPQKTSRLQKAGSHGCSKHYQATFKMNGKTISIFGVHLLAIPDDAKRCLEREAQATVVANMIKKAVAAGHEIICLGDFNDYSDTVPDVNDNKPISTVLKIIREAGKLVNIASRAPKEDRYTDWYDRNHNCIDDGGNEHSMIDHILVSAGLEAAITKVDLTHRWKNGCGCLQGDHWPVTVEFSF